MGGRDTARTGVCGDSSGYIPIKPRNFLSVSAIMVNVTTERAEVI